MPEPQIWLFEIAVLILTAKFLEGVSRRYGVPRVVLFVLLGVAVSFITYTCKIGLSPVLEAFATLGIVSLLFLAGLEGSLKYFIRGLKVAGLIAVGGVLGAFCCALTTMYLFNMDLIDAFLVGVILSATSVSVTVSTLEELGKLDSREAMLIVEAAVIDDVIGLVLLSFISALSGGVEPLTIISIPIIAFLVWYGTALFASRYMDSLLKRVSRLGASMGIEAFTLAILLVLSFLAQELGLASVLLAYAYGIGLAIHRYFAKKIASAVGFISAIFSPLFFIYVGYRLDLEYLFSVDIASILYMIAVVVALGFASKIIGCYIASRAMGLSHKSSLIIGVGMVPRSEVAMIAATAAYELELIEADLFASYLVMVAFTVIVPPILLKRIIGG